MYYNPRKSHTKIPRLIGVSTSQQNQTEELGKISVDWNKAATRTGNLPGHPVAENPKTKGAISAYGSTREGHTASQ